MIKYYKKIMKKLSNQPTAKHGITTYVFCFLIKQCMSHYIYVAVFFL